MPIVELETFDEKPSLGISACLMGEKVRYNGGHKRSSFCLDVLSQFFSFQKFCPEMAIGLGVPREPVRLVEHGNDYRAEGTKTAIPGVSDRLANFAKDLVHKLDQGSDSTISGYILMQKSPSCGMERVKIYESGGSTTGKTGSGIFARHLMESLPLLPVEEEGRLHDAVLRENFFMRVYAYCRWKKVLTSMKSSGDIEKFHARYKYILMAHDPECYGDSGRYLAENADLPLITLAGEYFCRFTESLKKHATRKSNTNALLHLLGYLKQKITEKERGSLLASIEAYRVGVHPLVVPVNMLKSVLSQYGSDYVNAQYYLSPYPEKLGLRNHI